MTTPIAFLAALAASILGLGYLRRIDQKRRRALGISRAHGLPQSKAAGWLLVISPGIVLVVAGQVSAFLAWSGAVMICAWLMAAKHPAA